MEGGPSASAIKQGYRGEIAVNLSLICLQNKPQPASNATVLPNPKHKSYRSPLVVVVYRGSSATTTIEENSKIEASLDDKT
jgi:hypothetical protein